MLEKIKNIKKETLAKAYVIAVVIVIMIPFALFFVFPSTKTTENKALSDKAALFKNGSFNVNYMKELSTYFEDRFAFRTYLVDANSQIRAKIFNTSPQDDVIVGKNGWLYYSATLDDYRGDDLSSDRELFAMARNVALIQGKITDGGADFVFTIAPNKNSLYPENMPAQYAGKISNDTDAKRLSPYLETNGVNYVNLFDLYNNQDEVLYLKRDSHWNKKGAVLSYNAILDAAGKEHESYESIKPTLSAIVIGDLNSMLYPECPVTEPDYEYDREYTYRYVYCDNNRVDKALNEIGDECDTQDVTLSNIITKSDNGNGNLLMYRDSFGNSLIDLFSEEYQQSYFSKMEPYDLSLADYIGADTVVLEKVERHIQSLAKVAPLMEAVKLLDVSDVIKWEAYNNEGISDVLDGGDFDYNEYKDSLLNAICGSIEKEADGQAKIDVAMENGMLKVSGEVDVNLIKDDSRIYVLAEDSDSAGLYEAFLIGENGFALYLDSDDENAGVKLFVISGDEVAVASDEAKEEAVMAALSTVKENMAELAKADKAIKEAEDEEERERLEAEALKKQQEEEEAKKLEEQKQNASSNGKTVVSKTFYEDCGSDTGYYEIIWSDGSITYQDVD